jgi:glycosyltransferase involved in cell wall biosynthesis
MKASNFSWYWEPLMKDLPSNCKIWGERSDVDSFYQAADLFVFTTKFELNPLSIKESLSWKLPILMRNLETYSDSYHGNSLVDYLTGDSNRDSQKILEILGFNSNL